MACDAQIHTPGRRGATAALWTLAAVLAVLAGALLMELGTTPSLAQSGSAGNGGRVLVVAGLVAPDAYGLYVLDTVQNTMAIYQWQPGLKQLKLLAARNYLYDLQLEDYNNDPKTTPGEIRRMVEQQRLMGATRPAERHGS